MKHHIDQLRRLCMDYGAKYPPFLLRTRFERHLYGLLVSFSESIFGKRPTGITENQVHDFLSRCEPHESPKEAEIVLRMSNIFGRFTYLCDTSNWSDDGQDPRLEMCREDILQLCNLVEMPKKLS